MARFPPPAPARTGWCPAPAFRAFGVGSVESSGFANNLFTSRSTNVWLGEVALAPPPQWIGNLYFAQSGPFVVRDAGASFTSLADWRAGRGQERLFGSPTGVQTDPLLFAPGSGGTIGDPTALATLDAYRLLGGSSANDSGLPLPSFGFVVGTHDFYDLPVPNGAGWSIGAHDGP
jgi:hypothetical protein